MLVALFGAGEIVTDEVKEIQVIHKVTYDIKTKLPAEAAKLTKVLLVQFPDAGFTFKFEKGTLYAATQDLGVFGDNEILLRVKHLSDCPTNSVYDVKAAQQLAEMEYLHPPFREFLTIVTRLRHNVEKNTKVKNIYETDRENGWRQYNVELEIKNAAIK